MQDFREERVSVFPIPSDRLIVTLPLHCDEVLRRLAGLLDHRKRFWDVRYAGRITGQKFWFVRSDPGYRTGGYSPIVRGTVLAAQNECTVSMKFSAPLCLIVPTLTVGLLVLSMMAPRAWTMTLALLVVLILEPIGGYYLYRRESRQILQDLRKVFADGPRITS